MQADSSSKSREDPFTFDLRPPGLPARSSGDFLPLSWVLNKAVVEPLLVSDFFRLFYLSFFGSAGLSFVTEPIKRARELVFDVLLSKLAEDFMLKTPSMA